MHIQQIIMKELCLKGDSLSVSGTSNKGMAGICLQGLLFIKWK